jgi:hypothetical protein
MTISEIKILVHKHQRNGFVDEQSELILRDLGEIQFNAKRSNELRKQLNLKSTYNVAVKCKRTLDFAIFTKPIGPYFNEVTLRGIMFQDANLQKHLDRNPIEYITVLTSNMRELDNKYIRAARFIHIIWTGEKQDLTGHMVDYFSHCEELIVSNATIKLEYIPSIICK